MFTNLVSSCTTCPIRLIILASCFLQYVQNISIYSNTIQLTGVDTLTLPLAITILLLLVVVTVAIVLLLQVVAADEEIDGTITMFYLCTCSRWQGTVVYSIPTNLASSCTTPQ